MPNADASMLAVFATSGRGLWLAGLLFICGSCGIPAVDQSDESAAESDLAVTSVRRVLLCLQGLSDRSTGWDKQLFALCEAAEDAGLVLIRDGEYAGFGALNERGAYKALFSALDENRDGRVDAQDAETQVALIGFSWGGINVTDIASRLRQDPRVSNSRRSVHALVMLDPYQPLSWRASVPDNVVAAWAYRQTLTTEDDCSASISFGYGFNGLEPLARSSVTACRDYDLDQFAGEVGHCDVPSLASPAAWFNVVLLADYEPWADQARDCPPF